jgi:hypothetical protein
VKDHPIRSTRALAAALLGTALAVSGAGAARAQPTRALAPGDPQAQVMGYFAAVMQFTPIGLPDAAARWELGGELTYIPALSPSERVVGFGGTKPEATNFCPVFPRLRASAVTGAWGFEAGYLPPIRACGVLPHMVSGAVFRRFALAGRWGAVLRASAHYGTLRAPITCDAAAVADPLNQTCFGGQVSDDRLTLLSLTLDGRLTLRPGPHGALEPYLLVGVRRESVRFDVHFQSAWGALDQQRLVANLTRVDAAVGAAWRLGHLRLGGELYYAPGALLTMRSRLAWAFGGTP